MTAAKQEPPQVYAAISATMAQMAKEGIAKGRKNQQQGYQFRGIDDVYAALGDVLAANKLVILPRVVGKEREERATQRGGVIMYTVLTVEFDLVSAVDGSMHTICMVGEAMDSADKSSNKAQSAALKYACLQAFMIPVEGQDNDADAVTHEVAPRQTRQTQQPRQTQQQTPFDDVKPLTQTDIDLINLITACNTVDDLTEWSATNGPQAGLSDNAATIRAAYKKRLDEINKPKTKGN